MFQGLVLVHSSSSSSAASSVSIDNVFTTTYNLYHVEMTFDRSDTAGNYLRFLKSSDGSEKEIMNIPLLPVFRRNTLTIPQMHQIPVIVLQHFTLIEVQVVRQDLIQDFQLDF